MSLEPWSIAALVGGGFACGFMNALSGGGSFVTFPLLLFLGLSPQVANATNRIAIVLQCVGGAGTYHRHGVLPWRDVPPLIFPSALGAITGALLAARLPEDAFRTASAVVLAGVALTIFVDTKRWSEERPGEGRIRPSLYPILFALGVYGGFLQIGLGTLLLAFFVLGGGYDVVRGNALKFGLVPIYQLLALGLFALAGQVAWATGITLAVGNTLGGIVGAHTVVKRGTRWVRWVVLFSAILGIAKLLVWR